MAAGKPAVRSSTVSGGPAPRPAPGPNVRKTPASAGRAGGAQSYSAITKRARRAHGAARARRPAAKAPSTAAGAPAGAEARRAARSPHSGPAASTATHRSARGSSRPRRNSNPMWAAAEAGNDAAPASTASRPRPDTRAGGKSGRRPDSSGASEPGGPAGRAGTQSLEGAADTAVEGAKGTGVTAIANGTDHGKDEGGSIRHSWNRWLRVSRQSSSFFWKVSLGCLGCRSLADFFM